jgi:hypothetical protein
MKRKNVIKIPEDLFLDLFTCGTEERDQDPTILSWLSIAYVPYPTATNTIPVVKLSIQRAIEDQIR